MARILLNITILVELKDGIYDLNHLIIGEKIYVCGCKDYKRAMVDESNLDVIQKFLRVVRCRPYCYTYLMWIRRQRRLHMMLISRLMSQLL